MDYKYEKAIINQSELNRESGCKKNMELIDELKEVYRKAKANPGVSRYIDLVNYIDKLEGGENDV